MLHHFETRLVIYSIILAVMFLIALGVTIVNGPWKKKILNKGFN